MGHGASCLSAPFPEVSPLHHDPASMKLLHQHKDTDTNSSNNSNGYFYSPKYSNLKKMLSSSPNRKASGNALSAESTRTSMLSMSSLSMNSDEANNANASPKALEIISSENADDDFNSSAKGISQMRINEERNTLRPGDYCKLPQIFHRRDLTHKNKLISSEKKIIYKLKIDWTVAQVIEREGTYLTLKLLNNSGNWEVKKRVWIMYVTKIGPVEFEEEARRLEYTLRKLNDKITTMLQKVREWHQECGHMQDSRIDRMESSIDVHYRCNVCGKVLAIERKFGEAHAKHVLEIFDMTWFHNSFPKQLAVMMDCKEGDCTLVRKKELMFAESKGWIRKIDRDLALFNSREHLIDALALLSNIGRR